MSGEKDERRDSRNKMTVKNGSIFDETQNSSYVNEISKDFDCLKISILNKASRVSGEFNKVTLGPRANHENGNISDSSIEFKSQTNSPVHNSSLSNNISFSIDKIFLENEVQRKEKVKKAIEQRKKDMEKSQRDLQEELSQSLSKKAIQKEKESAEEIARFLAEEEKLEQQQEMNKQNEMKKRKEIESQEILKKIIPIKEIFDNKRREFGNIANACRNKNSANALFTVYNDKLKEVNVQWESINQKAKTGDLTSTDLRSAEILLQYVDQLLQLFKAEIEQIEVKYEEDIRKELEMKQMAEIQEALKIKQMQEAENAAKQQQMNAQQIQNEQPPQYETQQTSEVDSATVVSQPPQYPNTPEESAPAGASTTQVPTENEAEDTSEYPDSESYQIFIESHKFLENYTLSYKGFVQAEAMKKFKFECQKTLNITINSISHVSREQLIDKYDKLRLFLSGKGNPNILLNPQAEAYSKHLLAQKIVDQGDTSISSKPEMAFPFAAIVVALWNDWPDFGQLLLARFRTVSPFFVPVFLVPRNDQSEEDYYKSLGCKYKDDGTPEKPEKYWKRLGGFMYLYASIMVTKQRQGVNKPHPHGIGNAWRWLAATLNIEPRADIADVCATLIFIILEVTGNDLWKTYPNQFPKLLYILNNVYVEKLKSFNSVLSAPISRLSDFLINSLKKGSIPPPKGQLPANFW